MQNAQMGFGGYDFIYGQETGIRNVQDNKQPEGRYGTDIYDLMGRKVSDGSHTDHSLKKGIYLKGGRKYIVR